MLFLPGKHPHTHQIFSKALKWFQCYTTKGITDSLKESISPLPKFTQPKAWAANNKDRWRRNTSPLGSSTALRHFPGEFHEHVGGAAASPCHPQCVEHRLQPFPSEQCYWERGEQLPIWAVLLWGTAWGRRSAQNKHKTGLTTASTEWKAEEKQQQQNCEHPAAFHTRDVNDQHKQISKSSSLH